MGPLPEPTTTARPPLRGPPLPVLENQRPDLDVLVGREPTIANLTEADPLLDPLLPLLELRLLPLLDFLVPLEPHLLRLDPGHLKTLLTTIWVLPSVSEVMSYGNDHKRAA